LRKKSRWGDQQSSLPSRKERFENIMKNPGLFFGGIVVAIIGLALGVFFLVPNVPHIIADSNMHLKHAIAFFCLAVVGIIAALVSRPKSTVRQ
jgi:hypothetical protein